jgi:translation initiation factor 1 (eIF-1/SUI1)
MGQIIQVTGDQRQKVAEFLAEECIIPKNKIKVHGF